MDEIVHVEAEGIDIIHVPIREMLTSLEMFRINILSLTNINMTNLLTIPSAVAISKIMENLGNHIISLRYSDKKQLILKE